MFHLYGFFIGLAIVVGYSLAERLEPKVAKIAPWAIGFGILGARIYHLIDMWEYYGQNLDQIMAVWNGGMSIWGGLIVGFAAFQFTIYKFQFTKTEKFSILGTIVTVLPLAQAIGRIGNGVNREFVNKVWGLPWWAAEAVLDLILFGILWRLVLRGSSSKVKVATYLLGYGLIRYLLQPYR